MKKFFVLFLVPYAEIQKMMATTKPEDMKEGMEDWRTWMDAHEASLADKGTMLGKTKRVTAAGIADVHNDITGYMIVQAESHEAAAKIFEDQPHLQMSGASIEVMTITEMPSA